MEFANKTVFPFEPGLSKAVAADAVATPYTTAADFRERLGDLARLSYLYLVFRYRVELDAESALGAATIKLTDGTTTHASAELDLTAAVTFTGVLDVEAAAIGGASALRVELEITSAADASRTVQVAGLLHVDHPLVIGTC